jgi:hypothetical protein
MTERIVVRGLTALEFRELEDAVGAEVVRKEDASLESAHHGEPGLITAALVVSAIAATAITVIFSRSRRRGDRRIVIERRTKEGTTLIQLEESTSEEDALDSETLKALADAFSIDLSALGIGSAK